MQNSKIPKKISRNSFSIRCLKKKFGFFDFYIFFAFKDLLVDFWVLPKIPIQHFKVLIGSKRDLTAFNRSNQKNPRKMSLGRVRGFNDKFYENYLKISGLERAF